MLNNQLTRFKYMVKRNAWHVAGTLAGLFGGICAYNTLVAGLLGEGERYTVKKLFAFMCLAVLLTVNVVVFSACEKTEKAYTVYEINAEYSPDHRTLSGTVKVSYENDSDEEISVLKFQTYPNAYRENALYKPISTAYADSAYYAGASYGEMRILSVNGSKNWEVMGEDENVLYVYLERSLFPGDKVVLDIGFITKLAEVNHRTGVTARTVNLGNFFPILCGRKQGGFFESVCFSDGDPFFSDCANFTCTLTVPKEYQVAATGEVFEKRTLESKKVYVMRADKVRDFAMVLSKDFRVLTERVEGTAVSYCYYADTTPEKSMEAIVESFCYYSETFGEYPYPAYTVAETGFCLGGMEYPCLTMLSDALTGSQRIRAIAHETAHQWWYAAVGSDQTENAWQDEGLAEYSAVTFFETYEKYGYTREKLVTEALREYRSYYDVYGSVLGRTDTRMTRSLAEYISDYEYRCIAYDKGVVMLDTLRKSVGDGKFFGALRRYYSANTYKMAAVEDFVAAFEKSGLDVGGFFDSFLNGKGLL